MIMATRLPQSPHGLLQEILADADLDVLGSAVFSSAMLIYARKSIFSTARSMT